MGKENEFVFAIEDGVRYVIVVEAEDVKLENLQILLDNIKEWWEKKDSKFFVMSVNREGIKVRFERI